jgi:transposase
MLGQERLTVVADAGYSSGVHASACERDGIVACAPANRAVNYQADGKLFDRSAFTNEPDTDSYRCPAGRSLVRKQLHGRKRNVAYMSSDCSAALSSRNAPQPSAVSSSAIWTRTHSPG